MRHQTIADLEIAARALLCVPRSARAELLELVFDHALQGSRHRAVYGVAHPQMGSGTLISACKNMRIAPRPPHLNPQMCECLQQVLIRIASHSRQ